MGRRAFMRDWAPVVGEEAASCQHRATRLLELSALLAAPFGMVLMIGLTSRNPVLAALGAALLTGELALVGAGCLSMQSSYRALSRCFGREVTWYNSPAFRPEAFERWMRRNGIGGSRSGRLPA